MIGSKCCRDNLVYRVNSCSYLIWCLIKFKIKRCLTNKNGDSHSDLKLPENLLGFGGRASLLVGRPCRRHNDDDDWDRGHHHHHHHDGNHQHHEIELCLSVTARGQIVATTCPPLLIFTSSSSCSLSFPLLIFT